ncbi:MAG: outer membrane beta-barrel protein [Fermentimonas sp.]|nr:outer membrane beta-barrel protein [Fermentimonas sp.]
MNKTVVLLIIFLTFSIPKIIAQFEGTMGIGFQTGYATEINSLGAGMHIHYYRTNNIRIAPSFTYFIERKGENMWMIDADAHYIIPVSFTASLYPIAGIHYSKWNFDSINDSAASVSEYKVKHRPGANLGLGFQHDIGYRVRANFELKYQFLKDYSQVVFMAGFGFWF